MVIGLKRLLSAVGAIILIAGFPPSGVAVAQAKCGDFYRVQRGDTLREITLKTLGHDRYTVVFRANRDVLPSPERLEVGQLIFVPCKDASVQDRKSALANAGLTPTPRDNLGDRAATGAPTETTIKVVTPSAPTTEESDRIADPVKTTATLSQRGALRILTASGMSPLADHALPDGGLLPILIREAFQAGGATGVHDAAFVDDRNAHLSVLMPTGAFDLTFPWPGVDCAKPGRGPTAQALCRDFLISRPIYEATVITIVAQDSSLVAATSTDALKGKRICRPAGFPPIDLEAMHLAVKIVIRRSVADCIALIQSGKADGMSVPMGQSSKRDTPGLVAASGLTWTVPVHALAWRQTPDADRTIAALNDGLQRLQKSGRWFNIVSRYLHDVNADSKLVAGN